MKYTSMLHESITCTSARVYGIWCRRGGNRTFCNGFITLTQKYFYTNGPLKAKFLTKNFFLLKKFGVFNFEKMRLLGKVKFFSNKSIFFITQLLLLMVYLYNKIFISEWLGDSMTLTLPISHKRPSAFLNNLNTTYKSIKFFVKHCFWKYNQF